MPEKRWTVNERDVGMGPQAHERLRVSYDEYVKTLSESWKEGKKAEDTRFRLAPVSGVWFSKNIERLTPPRHPLDFDEYDISYYGLDINNMNGLTYLNLKGEDMEDLSQELEDLLKMYKKDEEQLESKEKAARQNSDHFMKIYLNIKEEREIVTLKKNQLLAKLSHQDKCFCGCEEEDEDEE